MGNENSNNLKGGEIILKYVGNNCECKSDILKAFYQEWRVLFTPFKYCRYSLGLLLEKVLDKSCLPFEFECEFGIYNFSSSNFDSFNRLKQRFFKEGDFFYGNEEIVINKPIYPYVKDGEIKVKLGLKWINPKRSNSPPPSKNHQIVRVPGDAIGIYNQGGTCYMNSLLQVLFHIKLFRWCILNFPLNLRAQIFYILAELFNTLQIGSNPAETTALTKCFGWKPWECKIQKDYAEFTRFLFEQLNHYSESTPFFNFLPNIFHGVQISVVHSLDETFTSVVIEPFYSLFFSVEEHNSLKQAFEQQFSTPLIFDGNKKYDTGKGGYKDCTKTTYLRRLPPVLQIQLNRWRYDPETNEFEKNNSFFSFPEEIDLIPYVLPYSVNARYEKEIDENIKKLKELDEKSKRESKMEGLSNYQQQQQQPKQQSSSQPLPQTRHTPAFTKRFEGILNTTKLFRDDRPEVEKKEALKDVSADFKYILHAVVVHSGGVKGGHYYVYMRKWWNQREDEEDKEGYKTSSVSSQAPQTLPPPINLDGFLDMSADKKNKKKLSSQWWRLDDTSVSVVEWPTVMEDAFGISSERLAYMKQNWLDSDNFLIPESLIPSFFLSAGSSAYVLYYIRSLCYENVILDYTPDGTCDWNATALAEEKFKEEEAMRLRQMDDEAKKREESKLKEERRLMLIEDMKKNKERTAILSLVKAIDKQEEENAKKKKKRRKKD